MNLYEKLGVAITATKKEIKQAFKKLSTKHHPDKGGDTEEFKVIQKAYMVLSNDEKRDHYDKTGESESNNRNPDNALLQVFAAIIDNRNFQGNIIENIAGNLTMQINQIRKENTQLNKRERDLKTQKDRISAKNENFFEIILGEKIKGFVNKQESNLKAIEGIECLIKLINDYSDERPEEVIISSFDRQTFHSGTTGFQL